MPSLHASLCRAKDATWSARLAADPEGIGVLASPALWVSAGSMPIWHGSIAFPGGSLVEASAGNVDAGTSGVVIGAIAAITVGLVAAAASVATSRQQRAGMLVVAAMEHMAGGSQQRSAGLATLRVLRGRSEAWWRFSDHRAWREYAPSVGQHLFRQSIYVLHHGSRRYYAHEIENVIAMIDWLVEDAALGFRPDDERRARLLLAVKQYLTPGKTAADDDDGTPEAKKDKTRVELQVEALRTHAGKVWPGEFPPSVGGATRKRTNEV